MGPTLKNLHDLLSMPYGCGEQNMANFAPNIYVLKYLSSTRQLTDEIKEKAINYLRTGNIFNFQFVYALFRRLVKLNKSCNAINEIVKVMNYK